MCIRDRTYCQRSLHRQTLLLVGSHAASPPFGTVFLHLYALLIVSLVLGLSSRLRPTCSQDNCSRSAVRASDTLTRSFARYKFVTYSLTSKATEHVLSSTVELCVAWKVCRKSSVLRVLLLLHCTSSAPLVSVGLAAQCDHLVLVFAELELNNSTHRVWYGVKV